MKNFIWGLVLGIFGTYCYLTNGGPFRVLMQDFWVQASAPPPHHRAE